MLKKVITSVVIGALVAGCADLKPVKRPDDIPASADKAKARVAELWTEEAMAKEGKSMVVLYTPYDIPESLARKPISMTMEPGATIKDLTAILGNLGVSVIIADKDAAESTFYMPKYQGTLGHWLAAISRAADVWFTYRDGVITVSSKERIGLSIPQDEALAKKIGEGLTTIGVTGGLNSSDAGMAALELKYSQFVRAKKFLERMTENSAMVTLQVAIITVEMNQSDSQGIDWSKMQFALGKNSSSIFDPNGGAAPIVNNTVNPNGTTTPATTGTGTGSTTTPVTGPGSTTTPVTTGGGTDANGQATGGTTTVASTSLPAYLNTALLTGSSARLALTNKVFSLAGFVNFLGGYGNTETLQNVMLKTTTGNKVELKSVTQIPYVSSVGVATTGSTGANGSAGLLGSAKTSTANDGLTLKLTPSFDAHANTVTVNVDMSIQSVISFSSLQAGNQIGSLSQPTTADRSFNDVLRLRPGETVVVGGLTYESIAKNFSGPLGLRDTKYESKDLQTKKQTMFIVIRPTVRTFGAVGTAPSEELFPAGTAPAEEPVKHLKARAHEATESDVAPTAAGTAVAAKMAKPKKHSSVDPVHQAVGPMETLKKTATSQKTPSVEAPIPAALANTTSTVKLSAEKVRKASPTGKE